MFKSHRSSNRISPHAYDELGPPPPAQTFERYSLNSIPLLNRRCNEIFNQLARKDLASAGREADAMLAMSSLASADGALNMKVNVCMRLIPPPARSFIAKALWVKAHQYKACGDFASAFDAMERAFELNPRSRMNVIGLTDIALTYNHELTEMLRDGRTGDHDGLLTVARAAKLTYALQAQERFFNLINHGHMSPPLAHEFQRIKAVHAWTLLALGNLHRAEHREADDTTRATMHKVCQITEGLIAEQQSADSSLSPRERARLFYLHGLAAETLGDRTVAMNSFDAAVRCDPNFHKAIRKLQQTSLLSA